jgi:tetratricopeptide (TPR) repeat protein
MWGNYTAELVELEVQIGVLDAFPSMPLPRETLERTANMRVHMTDERAESAALPVLCVLIALQMADGDVNEMMRNLAIADQIRAPSAEVFGDGLSTHTYRMGELYFDDPQRAVAEMDAALDLDPGNPLLYAYRSGSKTRLGLAEDATRDAQTALRLGGEQWAMPLYSLSAIEFLEGDLESAIAYTSKTMALREGDWWPSFWRGALYYFQGKYDLAQADLERALELGPNENFAYVFATMIALRAGRIEEASALMSTILAEFPDPTIGNRVLTAMWGPETGNPLALLYAAFGHLMLGQHDAVVRDTEAALALNDQIGVLHLMQGFSHCNLRQYAKAEAAYTRGLEQDPGLPILHLLRAEARLRQGDEAGAMEDLNVLRDSEQAATLGKLIEPTISGESSCEGLFQE